MDLETSILEDVRESVGLAKDSKDFDVDLKMHINAAIGKLLQAGVVAPTVLTDDSLTWAQLQDPSKGKANDHFLMVPLYVTLSTKIIFDPPPPSTVDQYAHNIDQLLWRLKIAYECMFEATTDS